MNVSASVFFEYHSGNNVSVCYWWVCG